VTKKQKPRNEFEEHRERQRIAEEEKLKAKLALVEVRNRPRYGRAPKKIGAIVCETGMSSGYRSQRVSFVLRLDGADFIAEHGDVWYVSKSREALTAKMDEVARVAVDVRFARYIELDYSAQAKPVDSWRSSWREEDLDINESRKRGKARREIHGIKLQWKLVEYSNAFTLPGDDHEERFMKRDVDEKGHAEESSQTTVTKLPPGLIHYTKAREDLLRSIIEALGEIDAKLVELFRGAPEEVAARLDAKAGAPLLIQGK
jgi:hypothetical protein